MLLSLIAVWPWLLCTWHGMPALRLRLRRGAAVDAAAWHSWPSPGTISPPMPCHLPASGSLAAQLAYASHLTSAWRLLRRSLRNGRRTRGTTTRALCTSPKPPEPSSSVSRRPGLAAVQLGLPSTSLSKLWTVPRAHQGAATTYMQRWLARRGPATRFGAVMRRGGSGGIS